MIKYEEYFISNKDGKSNCVIRTFCKLFNKDWYHMVPIIDNVLYDKTNDSLELYVISLYKITAK